jgi:hypothetical protein
MMDANTADHVGGVREFEIGSAAHRRGLARFFLDTHIDYEPDRIQWPVLGETERSRLISLPFWQEAVNTESETSRKVMAAAQLESDAQLRKAIELQGFEEYRHARLLAALTARYRIPIQTPPGGWRPTMRACCVPGWFQPLRACSTGCCRRVFDCTCAAPGRPRCTA